MSTYLLINFAIIFFPLILSLLPRYRSFYRHWRQLIGSILLVGAIFITWDIWVTAKGHWAFNPAHILGQKWLFLPIEEWLFFITVPFSCLFLYQALKNLYQTASVRFNLKPFIFVFAATCFLTSLFLYPKTYTMFVLFFTALTAIVVLLVLPSLYSTKAYLLYTLLGIGLFFIFNTLLTSIPVVTYNHLVITNIRLGTIPLEDLFYNWSLLTLYAFFYDWLAKKGHYNSKT